MSVKVLSKTLASHFSTVLYKLKFNFRVKCDLIK